MAPQGFVPAEWDLVAGWVAEMTPSRPRLYEIRPWRYRNEQGSAAGPSDAPTGDLVGWVRARTRVSKSRTSETGKAVMRFRRFGLRGVLPVRGEWDLVCAAFNPRRISVLLEATG